ncbi:hypothetical protein pipiens_000888, partial [Culex pipiens pipiens]
MGCCDSNYCNGQIVFPNGTSSTSEPYYGTAANATECKICVEGRRVVASVQSSHL